MFPPEALSWAKENRIDYIEPPPTAPGELKHIRNNPTLRVVSPLSDKKYYLNPHLPAEKQKIPLLSQFFADSRYLYWFIDGKLRFEGPTATDYFFPPEAGRHSLLCIDNQGRSGSVSFEVIPLD